MIRPLPGVPIFTGIIIGASLIALAILHQRGEVDASAAVGFLGSVVGTAGAVFGALYVERWKRLDLETRDKGLLIASLSQLLITLEALGQEPVLEEDPKENFEHELFLIGETRHAMMETDAALQAADYGRRLSQAELIVELHRVQRVITYRLPLLTNEVEQKIPESDLFSQRALELLSIAEEAQESLTPFVKAALARLNGKKSKMSASISKMSV